MPNIHLTKPMKEFVEAQVASGAYANASEVVRDGMRRLMEAEGAFDALKTKVDAGVDDLRQGRTVWFDPHAYEPGAFGKGK